MSEAVAAFAIATLLSTPTLQPSHQHMWKPPPSTSERPGRHARPSNASWNLVRCGSQIHEELQCTVEAVDAMRLGDIGAFQTEPIAGQLRLLLATRSASPPRAVRLHLQTVLLGMSPQGTNGCERPDGRRPCLESLCHNDSAPTDQTGCESCWCSCTGGGFCHSHFEQVVGAAALNAKHTVYSHAQK